MIAPWNVSLPEALTVGGEERPIRTDYRVALDCFLALTDSELDDYNKLLEVLDCLYVDEPEPHNWLEAINQAIWYLNGGKNEDEHSRPEPRLVSWEQDFTLIAAPISAQIGKDVRSINMHWWTFIQCYQSIGDCLFAQVVRIRDMKARGKKMEKADREFYRRNRDIIDIKTPLTKAEEDFLKEWV